MLSDFSYKVSASIGPHHTEFDGLRTHCSVVQTDNPKALYDPIPGYRRQAEWDDHGEAYAQSFSGPDLWINITVPKGVQQVSLYFINKDGHDATNAHGHYALNRYRDYLVELKPYQDDLTIADSLPTLAQTRVRDFWGGVYKSFAVRHSGKFWIKISKNGSVNAIVSAVLLDKLAGPPTVWETRHSGWYGKDTYKLPAIPKMSSPSVLVAAAKRLWEATEKNADKQEVDRALSVYRLLAYRAVNADVQKIQPKSASLPEVNGLLANWRWSLCLWNPAEREAFWTAMQDAWQGLAEINPQLKLGNQ